MQHIIFIFTDIILPVFVLIAIGVLLQRKFKLDMYTLAKLNIYFLSPGLIFIKLYDSSFSLSLFFSVILFCSAFVAVLFFLSAATGRILKLNEKMKLSFSNSVMFYNSGNYGIPVNDLVFKQDPFAMSIQIAVMAFQNTLLFSYGVVAMNSINTGKLKAVLAYFRMPLFYAMFLGILFNVLNISLPNFILTPVTYISNSLIAMVLLTLGAQIAHIKISLTYVPLYLSIIYRLIIGPSIALVALLFLGIDGIIAQALLISTAMPTSVNSAIIAQEYNSEPEFAGQTVIASTLFSSFTLTFVIYIALIIF
ncbi:AEC family transporter [Lederbergia citrea]|uniref:AEC family transporter n=1 Tax=Lederbergia citrea TaxID=2833581 RepID=A0A942Z3J0_9BACI|nr:AEC family transporter [Lederbergia citrea]MBS4177338.1 AEC family transporter [Lederbergia citrea]MBS4204001.1 AEC family transporter [Lederbergia citrea]MBS4221415.1 AEC family transporter [Lederbergia citrea]